MLKKVVLAAAFAVGFMASLSFGPRTEGAPSARVGLTSAAKACDHLCDKCHPGDWDCFTGVVTKAPR